ncbi:hypothetical protein KC573_02575, partial [candidate division WWE3 bacterium]|nr:hypothetical protein [candidate division WWE3 bacterium]
MDTGGTVGQGSTALSWSDDDGGSGSLDLGSSYHAPLPLEVADGLQLGFDTGTISNGASFTVAALTPRDTFTYTVESEPFTPPVIVVSYSDPQGSHRFVTPVELDSLADDLIVHSGQMLPDVNVSIVTTAEVDPMNTNDTNFIINSPHPEPIVDANLYLNFVADGNLVEEITQTMTLQPGPTVIPVQWSTDTFSETYDIEADNILIAFWTDAQNNIIDSAARPLSTFQKDPTAKSAISETEWDFGSLVQGEIVEKEITLANIGFAKLWDIATVNGEGLSVTPNNTNRVFPATSQKIKVVLDTAELPAGPYSGQIIIKSSDVVSPQTIINLTGTILPLSGNVLANDVSDYLPWDQTVFITGTFNLNDIVTFSHNIPDEPPNIHPLYVYEEQSGNLLGVGEYGIDFTGEAGTSVDFGDGSAGDLIVNSGETFNINSIRTPLDGIADSGQNIIPVIDVTNFNAGDEILVIQAHGSGAGNYEFKKIVSINDNNLILNKPLQHSYESRLPIATVYREPNFTGIFEVITHNDNNVFNNPIDNDTISSIQVSSGTTVILYQNRDYGGTYETFTQDDPNLSDNLIGDNTTTSVRVFSTQKAQVIRVPNYQNVTVNAGGVLDTLAWNSTTHEGGILVFRANGIVQIDDDINVDWNGHPRGDRGHYGNFIKSHGWQGQSISLEGIQSINANHGGGGGAQGDDDSRDVGAGGGGGGYGTVGQSGQEAGSSSISLPGQGGNTYGSEDLTDAIHFGSGGGGGGADNMVANTGGYGGNGGGIIIIAANEFNTNNHITSNGNNGTNGFSGGNTGGGGGGSGGSILIIGSKVSLGNELVTSLGGAGGQAGLNGGVGGAGGEGRIHVQYCDEISGSTNPPAYEE